MTPGRFDPARTHECVVSRFHHTFSAGRITQVVFETWENMKRVAIANSEDEGGTVFGFAFDEL